MVRELFRKFTKEDFFKNVNLHIHSNLSDGRCDFDEIVKQAQKNELKYFSITDHNTLEGYVRLQKNLPDNLITGVEFDCFFDFNLPHILGYGVDINNKKLNALTTNFKKGKFEVPIRILSSRCPKKVIEAIHDAGGIAVLAHPCCYWCFNLEGFLKKLIDFGLDGVEVFYPYDRLTRFVKFHSRKTVVKLAKKYDLIMTGGEDEHGELKKQKGEIDWGHIL